MHIQSATCGARGLDLVWADGGHAMYPYVFLRDNCPSGFHSQTHERTFDLLSVPAQLRPSAMALDGEGVHIVWDEPGGHRSSFSPQWLGRHRPGQRRADPADVPAALWGHEFAHALPRYSVGDLGDPKRFKDWLITTKRLGLSLVTGLDDDEDAAIAIGQQIGFLRQTNFGETFRVETIPQPNNLAYTAQALPLHTDLPNQELPPGFQFLHCVRNGAQGGESLFADAFQIAETIRTSDPEAFALLTTVPIPYRFHDADYDLRIHRPLIGLDERGRVFDVRYSAHLIDSLDMEAGLMAEYYPAFRLFMAQTRDERFRIAYRLAEGEMAVFDNRRVMHGRAAFDPASGHRLLRGFYVDRGEFDSRIRLLERSAG